MTLLQVTGLGKSFGSATGVTDIDLTVQSGSRTAIVGPSGCGKTTLLRLIAGFITPDQGQILLDGTVIADGPHHSMPAHRRGIGLVAQDGALFPHLTIAENVGFGLAKSDPDRPARIADLMLAVGLDAALRQRRPHELSGGQQQRVALARALAMKPRLMLLDEPFSALDTGLRAATRDAVVALLDSAGIAAVLVTHDQAEALSFADQVAVMRGGRFLEVGAPRSLYLRPRTRMVAEFLGEAVVLEARVTHGVALCALGQVPVDAAVSADTAQLLLRPEQIVLTPDAGPAPQAEVVAVSFAGALCTVVVQFSQPTPYRLTLRRSFVAPPSVGDRVTVSVIGKGHLVD